MKNRQQPIKKFSFEELQKRQERLKKIQPFPVSVIVDNIRSLHNVGAIFRTADGANVERIYLCGISGTPPRNEIRKTSLGAEQTVPWNYEKDAANVVQKLKKSDYQIVVLEQTSQSVDYKKAEYKFPLCLVVGHEYDGIQEDLITLSDIAIEIPMFGHKLSLNVSVAFGIAIYEIMNRI